MATVTSGPDKPEPDALLLEVRALREQVRDLLVVQLSVLSLLDQWARHQGVGDDR